MTFVQVVPFIEQAQSEEAISTVKTSFLNLDSTVKTLISESGEPGGFRTSLFRKSSGELVFEPEQYYIVLKLLDQNSNLIYNFTNLETGYTIGALDWIYNIRMSMI